jgi:hypothetical protein
MQGGIFARNVGHLFSLRAMTKLKCTWGLLMSKISLSRHMKSGPYIVKRGCNRSRAPHNTNVAVIALIKGHEVFIAPLFSMRIQQMIDLAFLAPDIVRDVLDGKQPIGFTSDWFKQHGLPSDWKSQRQLLATL